MFHSQAPKPIRDEDKRFGVDKKKKLGPCLAFPFRKTNPLECQNKRKEHLQEPMTHHNEMRTRMSKYRFMWVAFTSLKASSTIYSIVEFFFFLLSLSL